MPNKRSTGTQYEEVAAAYLRDKGYTILDRNFRDRSGEIDIIALCREALVFVEVKYRSTDKAGDPLEAVDARKQQQIRRIALKYMNYRGYNPEATSIRFDCIGITDGGINHVENAF
jgi:putative endonuclease